MRLRRILRNRFRTEKTAFDALGLRLWERLSLPAPRARLLGVQRFSQNPIIHPDLSPSIGDNICGPSLVAVPKSVPNRLGAYYLYFAHHRGRFIRMAYADQIEGPWTIHEPGVLTLEAAPGFTDHIASPDVHFDPAENRFLMYFHGPSIEEEAQLTAVAQSTDGVHFDVIPGRLGKFYFRVWTFEGQFYALAKNFNSGWNEIYVGASALGPFRRSRNILRRARHTAVFAEGSTLLIFYSRVGDRPERILLSTIDMRDPFEKWTPSRSIEVLRPETSVEGADLPSAISRYGAATDVQQLRDPFLFRDGERFVLLYALRGEAGLGAARIDPELLPGR